MLSQQIPGKSDADELTRRFDIPEKHVSYCYSVGRGWLLCDVNPSTVAEFVAVATEQGWNVEESGWHESFEMNFVELSIDIDSTMR